MAAAYLEKDEIHKKLRKIGKKKIPYPDNLIIPEKPELILDITSAIGLDFKYPPVSIDDIAKPLDDDNLRKSFESNMLESDYLVTEVKSDIVTELVKQNFKVMTAYPRPNPVEPKLNFDASELILGGIITVYEADPEILLDEDVSYNFYSIILGTKKTPKKIWSFSTSNEAKPITILKGFDPWLRPYSNIMPLTAMHVCNISEIEIDLRPTSTEDDLSSFRYLAYYLRNSLLKFGSIYWLVKDDENVYLYDLTSSFQLNDYDNEHNAELKAVKNAVGLMYFYCAKKCYLENDEKHFKLIKNWLYSAVMLIDESANPLEYNIACLLHTMKLILNNPNSYESIECVIGDREFAFLIYKNMAADNISDELDLQLLEQSTERLENGIQFIITRLTEKEINPFEIITPNLETEDFSLKQIISKLKKFEFDVVGNRNVKTDDQPIVNQHIEGWDCTTLVYILLKLFQNFLSIAKLEETNNRLGISFAYLKLCLKIWNYINGLTSPTEPLPLPLEPLLRMGEISYRFSCDWDLARRECQTCEELYSRKCDEYLENNTFITTDKRCDLQFPDENDDFRLPFAKLSFEYYARAILYTDVEPSHNLLLRICHISNVISYTYLTNFHECIANLQSCERSIELLKQISKFVYVSLKFSLLINEGNILMAYCNRARYLKTYYHIHDFLKSGRHNTDLLTKSYDKIIEEYKDVESCIRLKSELPANVWNVFVWDFTQFIMEYINLLKEMEIQDKKYHHKKILRNYQLLILLATELGKVSLMIPYTNALIAEYLFDIYLRRNKLCAVRDATEMCYKKSISTFGDKPDLVIVEFLKLNLDLVNFYQTILNGMSPNSPLIKIYKYYDKIMEVLFRCKDALESLIYNKWKYEPPTASTVLNSESMTNILLKTLQEKLKQTFELSLQRQRMEKRKDKYYELLELSRNIKNIPLIQNLNEVLCEAEVCFSPFRNKDFMKQLR